MDESFPLFPEQASTFAGSVDALYGFLLLVSGFFTALICVLIMGFAIRYNRRAKVDRSNPPESMLLEIGWSIVPFVLSMVMFFWGATLFFNMRQPPPDAEVIYVVGKQWMWKLQHPGGKREINELHIPLGKPFRLKMISEDVIHSFFVPAFRVKQDVLPGRYTEMWFQATKVGTYHLFCAEYCGTSHSGMIGKVIVMEPADYAAWLAGESSGQPAEVAGGQLFAEFRCGTCHQEDGRGRGPSLVGIADKQVKLQDGTTVTADEAYLRESILDPRAKVVQGYQPLMPTYQGQIGEEGIFQIIAYLKTLKAAESETADTEAADGKGSGSDSSGNNSDRDNGSANGNGDGQSNSGNSGQQTKD